MLFKYIDIASLLILSGCSIHYWKWNVEVSSYYFITVYVSIQSCQWMLYTFRFYAIRCIYIYTCYIFLKTWSIYQYVMSPVRIFDLKSILWDKYSHSCSLFVAICMEYLFFFYPFTFSLRVSLILNRVLWRQHIQNWQTASYTTEWERERERKVK